MAPQRRGEDAGGQQAAPEVGCIGTDIGDGATTIPTPAESWRTAWKQPGGKKGTRSATSSDPQNRHLLNHQSRSESMTAETEAWSVVAAARHLWKKRHPCASRTLALRRASLQWKRVRRRTRTKMTTLLQRSRLARAPSLVGRQPRGQWARDHAPHSPPHGLAAASHRTSSRALLRRPPTDPV